MADKDDLFNWCISRPHWQQEALRVLAANGKLEVSLLDQLEQVIRANSGLSEEVATDWPALAEADLRSGIRSTDVTVLGSIGPLQNIDRLAADQPPLRFGVSGITLIYGANGSGKSGYSRIAKKVCRSLHEIALRGNVYATESLPREVCLSFRVGSSTTPVSVRWKDGDVPPPELSRISVFDSDCAALYVDSERQIEFLPFELDLLTNLAGVLRDLDRRFREEEAPLAKNLQAPIPAGFSDNTRVSATIRRLQGSGNLPTEAEIRELGTWSAEDESRLSALNAAVNGDPALALQLQEAVKVAVSSTIEDLERIANVVGAEGIAKLLADRERAAETRRLAQAAAKGIAPDAPIQDLGSDNWRRMFSYARKFAFEAFPSALDPKIAKADVCVLCQQPLDAEAQARLAQFDAYVAGKASEDADAARIRFEEAARIILDLKVQTAEQVSNTLESFGKTDERCTLLAESVRELYAAIIERVKLIQGAIRENSGLDNLPPLSFKAFDDLKAETTIIQLKIDELRPLAANKDSRDSDRKELLEATEKKKFAAVIELFVARRNDLERQSRLKNCIDACAVGSITTKITQLRRKVLTPTLSDAFKAEVRALDLVHLPLKLADRGEVGKSKVHIGLDASQKINRNSDILSEGERRALALAGFLAELNEVGSKHGIIIDDPVSSLDHSRIEAVAQRLIAEAKAGRQVVIFTHNLFFHYCVTSMAIEMRVPLHREWIAKRADGKFGIIDEAQKPWAVLGVKERIEYMQGIIKAVHPSYDHKDESNRAFVKDVYTRARETWERAIEEILFANVIGRFRPDVQTQRLRAAQVETEDYEAVRAGMTRCSKFSGHDQSLESPPELPALDDIEKDISELSSFFDRTNARKKSLEKERRVLEEEPVAAELLN